MTRLPPRRTHPKMGVRETERREFPAHRRFVRSHQCCVPSCLNSHVKTRGAGEAACHADTVSRRLIRTRAIIALKKMPDLRRSSVVSLPHLGLCNRRSGRRRSR